MSLSRLEIAFLLALAIAAAYLSYERNLIWQTDITLWQDVIVKSPHKVRPANNLARELVEEGRCHEAIGYLRAAISKDPYYAEPHFNMGLCFVRTGQYAKALSAFNNVIKITDVLIKGHYGEMPDITMLVASHGYVANIYTTMGDYQRAIAHYRKALDYSPSNRVLLYNLGITLKKARRYPEAIEVFKKVLKLNPDDEGARWNLTLLESLVR